MKGQVVPQAVLSSFFYAFWVLLKKRASDLGLSGPENQSYQVAFTCAFAWALNGSSVRMPGTHGISTTGILMVAAAGLCGTLGGALYERAAKVGNAATVSAIVALYPAVACVLGAAFLSQPVKPNEAAGVALAAASVAAFSWQ